MTHLIQRPIMAPKVGVIAATLLFLAGAAMPAAAQVKRARDLSADRPVKGSVERAVAGSYAEGTLTEAELRQVVNAVVEAETRQWNSSEKSVMKAVMALDVEDTYLLELAALSEDDLSRQLKRDEKLSDLKGINVSNEAALKALPAAFVIRAATWAGARLFEAAASGVIDEIARMSAPNIAELFSALSAGDMVQFQSLLASAFPRHETFVRLTEAAASSFCSTATLGLSKRTCTAFAESAHGAAEQIRRRANQTVRPVRHPVDSRRSPVGASRRGSERLFERLSGRLFGSRTKGLGTPAEPAQLK